MVKSKKILIVEDEIFIFNMMREFLKLSGYDVVGPVVTGEEAVSKALSEKPDIILMDICLAGEIDGFEAAKRIISSIKVPVVFMTGYCQDEHLQKADKINRSAYISKPVMMDDLHQLLQSQIAL